MHSPKSPITYVRRPSSRLASLKGKAILQNPKQTLHEAKKLESKVGEQQETKEEDIGHMEEKLKEMGEELSGFKG